MNNPLKLAKAGISAALAVKDAAKAAAHPVTWAKDKLVEAAAGALLSALTKTVGPQLARAALERLDLVDRTLPFSVRVPVPNKFHGLVGDAELALLTQAANEVLAGPLELLGYRLVKVQVTAQPEDGSVLVGFEAGLMRMQDAAPAQASTAAALPSASLS